MINLGDNEAIEGGIFVEVLSETKYKFIVKGTLNQKSTKAVFPF